ncbi:hypothetical protein M3Y94_00064100 [Aphelenchoides besseyi]|nr:hypothetical protein M3Y94_00064100 [Aphelenchoides besseyi]KAI6237924.1 hypothetical protein M3Y95_00316000 [Aphelenchoides besseyi]
MLSVPVVLARATADSIRLESMFPIDPQLSPSAKAMKKLDRLSTSFESPVPILPTKSILKKTEKSQKASNLKVIERLRDLNKIWKYQTSQEELLNMSIAKKRSFYYQLMSELKELYQENQRLKTELEQCKMKQKEVNELRTNSKIEQLKAKVEVLQQQLNGLKGKKK